MRSRHWMGAVYATFISLLIFQILAQELDILSARKPTPDDVCDGSIYCTNGTGTPVWRNDCDFDMPSEKLWKANRQDDAAWLSEHLQRYLWRTRTAARRRDSPDRLTFSTYMLKLYAPNVPPSNMLCDGLGMCRAPSCMEIGRNYSSIEKSRAMLFFETMSGLDHGHHVMTEAVRDHFRHIHEDIDKITRDFSYADEQQDKAVKKDEKKKKQLAQMGMAFAIITAIFALISALAGIMALQADSVACSLSESAAAASVVATWTRAVNTLGRLGKIGRLTTYSQPSRVAKTQVENAQKIWTIANHFYAGSQGLTTQMAKNINHKKDLKGFDKTLEGMRRVLTGLDKQVVNQTSIGMQTLNLGGRSQTGNNIVDMYKSAYFSGANINFRSYVAFQMEMRSYASIINELWRTEGVYVVESEAANGDCDKDSRGPPGNKVCLEERPKRSYWVQTIGNWRDNKIRYPPGIEKLNNTESHHGLWLGDVVRSSLWWDEVWKPSLKTNTKGNNTNVTNSYLPELDAYDPDAISNTTYLTDYGNVPGTFHLPVCRSWNGEAISDTNTTHHANSPCLCDSVDPAQRSSWSSPNNYTLAFTRAAVKDGEWYNFNSYGKMCLKHHGCNKQGSWKTFLNLTGEEKPAKHMKHAWTACESKGHGEHKLGPPQLSEPEETNSTSTDPQVSGIAALLDPPMATPTGPSRLPLMRAEHRSIGNVTRSPEKRSEDAACAGSQCIVDTVYEIVEQSYAFNVDAANPANGCFPGHAECVEDSAYNLCEYFDDEEEDADIDENEIDDAEEYDGDAKDPAASEPHSLDTWPNDNSEPFTPKAKDPMKAFEEEIALTNERQACFCGGAFGMNAQPGISCHEEGSATTRTTTVKGTTPPPASHSSTPVASGPSPVVKALTITGTNEKTTMPATLTTTEWVVTITLTPQTPSFSFSVKTVYANTDGSLYPPGFTALPTSYIG